MADVNINNVDLLEGDLADTYNFIMSVQSELKRLPMSKLRSELIKNDDMLLNEIAFYIDVNEPISGSSTRVNTGGNMRVFSVWEQLWESVIMDENGNYCRLNANDCRYTEDGYSVVDSDGEVEDDFAHGDFMVIIPTTYIRIQQVSVGGRTYPRMWMSITPLPGGAVIPRMVIGKFKINTNERTSSAIARSLPGVEVTTGNSGSPSWGSFREFYSAAQNRSVSHGLINMECHNMMMYYVMAKYGQRDPKTCSVIDGSPIWGVGLDGTESIDSTVTSVGSGTLDRQRVIKTGATLVLGNSDGNVEVEDSVQRICHSVSVHGIENPWGQFQEFVQGCCTIGETNMYVWRANFIPPEGSTPSAQTFENIEHAVYTLPAYNGAPRMRNVACIGAGMFQGFWMTPDSSYNVNTAIEYNAAITRSATGLEWRLGGGSDGGANTNLARVYNDALFTSANPNRTSRLQYYGNINRVTTARFIELGE